MPFFLCQALLSEIQAAVRSRSEKQLPSPPVLIASSKASSTLRASLGFIWALRATRELADACLSSSSSTGLEGAEQEPEANQAWGALSGMLLGQLLQQQQQPQQGVQSPQQYLPPEVVRELVEAAGAVLQVVQPPSPQEAQALITALAGMAKGPSSEQAAALPLTAGGAAALAPMLQTLCSLLPSSGGVRGGAPSAGGVQQGSVPQGGSGGAVSEGCRSLMESCLAAAEKCGGCVEVLRDLTACLLALLGLPAEAQLGLPPLLSTAGDSAASGWCGRGTLPVLAAVSPSGQASECNAACGRWASRLQWSKSIAEIAGQPGD